MLEIIDSELQENNEFTSQQLKSHLKEQFPLLDVSLPTIKHVRKERGFRLLGQGAEYTEVLLMMSLFNGSYENMLLGDACMVQLVKICFRKSINADLIKFNVVGLHDFILNYFIVTSLILVEIKSKGSGKGIMIQKLTHFPLTYKKLYLTHNSVHVRPCIPNLPPSQHYSQASHTKSYYQILYP